VAGILQVDGDQFLYGRFVFHDQNLSGHMNYVNVELSIQAV
jgi:hypothetical protein